MAIDEKLLQINNNLAAISDEVDGQALEISRIRELLATKAAPSGEDVTAETNTYTEKIAQLTTAVTALETELAGKASGGGASSGGSIEVWTGTVFGSRGLGLTSECTVHYIDGELRHQTFIAESQTDYPITILAGSFIGCVYSEIQGIFLLDFPTSDNFETYL